MRRLAFCTLISKTKQLPPALLIVLSRLNKRYTATKTTFGRDSIDLELHIDDTPVDGFLRGVSDEIDALEKNIFGFVLNDPSQSQAQDQKYLAGFYGRLIAQDVLASNVTKFSETVESHNVFSLLSTVLGGGEWLEKLFLLRRLTESGFSYELQQCPHVKLKDASPTLQNAACQIQAEQYNGFFESIWPRSTFIRERRQGYCVDLPFAH